MYCREDLETECSEIKKWEGASPKEGQVERNTAEPLPFTGVLNAFSFLPRSVWRGRGERERDGGKTSHSSAGCRETVLTEDVRSNSWEKITQVITINHINIVIYIYMCVVHIYTYICRCTYIHSYPLCVCVGGVDLKLYPSCNLTGYRLSGAPGWQEETPRAQPSHRHQASHRLAPLSDPIWWYRAAWQETAQSGDWTPTQDSGVETWSFHKEDRSKTR